MAEQQQQQQQQQQQPPQQPPVTATPPATPPAPGGKSADEIRAEAEAALKARLKEITGHDSLDALATAQKVAEEKRLSEQGEFAKLAEQRAQEAQKWQAKFQDSVIRQAVLGACLKHNAVDGDVVLALVRSEARVDENGAVTIGGKAAEEAIAAMLKAKPFLVKPERSGSGSPSYPDPGSEQEKAKKETLEKAKQAGDTLGVLRLLRPAS